jgi:hypothetical protein
MLSFLLILGYAFFSMVEIRLELIFYSLILYKINDFHNTQHMPRTVSTFMYCVIQPAYGNYHIHKNSYLTSCSSTYKERCFVNIASSIGYLCSTIHTKIPILLH